MQSHLDLRYKTNPGMSPYERECCLLDLYIPEGVSSFPTALWLHGGGLTGGDKRSEADVALATRLAQAGIATASANYRLAPHVAFPAFVEDAAAAFVWLENNIEHYGGHRNRLLVGGGSAGGYLAAMIGYDASQLRSLGSDPSHIRGLFPVSGQVVTHFTIRAARGVPQPDIRPLIDLAAPCYHARADAPPTLLICGSVDMAMRAAENQYFAALLRTFGHRDTTYMEFEGRDHGTILSPFAQPGDPVADAVITFINRVAI